MSKVETYDYGEGLQERIVGMFLYDVVGFSKYMDVVKPEYFDNPILRYMVEVIFKFYEKYGKPPLVEELLEELKPVMEKKRVDATEWTDVFENMVRAGHKGEFEYVQDKILDFAKYQAVKNAVLDSATALQKHKDYDAILSHIESAMLIGETTTDLGSFYLRELDERIKKRAEGDFRKANTIPFGVQRVDYFLGGGIAPPEVGIIMSFAKRGKTTVAVFNAVNAMGKGKNVIFYGLEGLARETEAMVDACISSVPRDELEEFPEEVRDAVKSFKEDSKGIGRLIIKHHAPGLTTMNIEAHIQRMKLMEDFEPDLLIIDYLGLMGLANKDIKTEASSSGKYHLLGCITKELLVLAHKYNVAIWLLHQTNRGSKKKSVIEMDDSGDSIIPMQDAHLILTLNQTKDEADPKLNPVEQKMRLFLAGGRYMRDRRTVHLLINKAKCQMREDPLEPTQVEDSTGLTDGKQ